MLDVLNALGPTERSIVVQTRRGTNITNVVEKAPTPGQFRQYQQIAEKHNWVARKPPTGVYNCTGHVWASRRTSLVEAEQWRLILQEDDYRRLEESEEPVPDDIVVYVDRQNEEIVHVGRVLELREGVSPGSPKIPWVVSKWGPVAGEALHYVHDIPYPRLGYSIRTEYWTDRAVARRGRL